MNITLFEMHLDDAKISPVIGGSAEDAMLEESMDAESMDAESGLSRRYPLGLLVLAGLVAFVAARRFRGGDEGVDLEIDSEADPIAVE